MPRITYEEYVLTIAEMLAARHRPVWSWDALRRMCACGGGLPCRVLHPVRTNAGHWSA